MHDQSNAVWANKILDKVLPHLPQQTYLVGGCVRDLILGTDPSDFDLVTFGPPMDLALEIGAIVGGKAFFIDSERQVARVALNHGKLTIDVSPPRGADIESDLAQRDITINAMAINPADGTLVDLHGGRQDLKERRIRLIAEKNLTDDPLRGLRCLRFSVQLRFFIDSGTMELIRKNSLALERVSPERIKQEFLKALGCPEGSMFFSLLADARYIPVLFGVSVDKDRLSATLEFASEMDRLFHDVRTCLPGTEDHFEHELEHGLTREAALRLAAFFAGMPGSMLPGDEPDRVYSWCKRLAFSSKACHVIAKAISGLRIVLSQAEKPVLTGSEVHRLFSSHEECIPEMLLLAIVAHSRESREQEDSFTVRVRALWEYFVTVFTVHSQRPLLTGDDIMEAFCMPCGPKIGLLLRQVEEARADGLISNTQQALEYLRKNISE
ncbi:MAG: CCA tRNA nucleotidyltransferase [Desulfomonilia bacterium]